METQREKEQKSQINVDIAPICFGPWGTMYRIMLVTNITIKASPAVKDVNFLILIFTLSKFFTFQEFQKTAERDPLFPPSV